MPKRRSNNIKVTYADGSSLILNASLKPLKPRKGSGRRKGHQDPRGRQIKWLLDREWDRAMERDA